MNVSIFSQHFTITQGLSSHIQRSLSFALDHVEDSIQSISVRLSESSASSSKEKCNKEKCCKIIVKFTGHSQVFIEESFSDLYAAIDKAVKRLKRVVGKQVSRHRDFRREKIDFSSLDAELFQQSDEEVSVSKL